ncbi:hypothetical protein AHF37_05448, partial [Paragonimus kellicotti]
FFSSGRGIHYLVHFVLYHLKDSFWQLVNWAAAQMTEDHNSLEDQQPSEKTSFRYNLLAGGLAGSVAKTVIAPLDRAKINFQSTERRFTVRELYRFLRNSFHEAGFLSLWRGNTATLSRIFPYAAIQYSAHERYKHALGIDQSDLSHMRPRDIRLRRLIAGCMAGTTCVACTYPLDFSRARMAVTDSKKYSNLIDAIRTVSREEGKLALYRGFLPAILGVIPYSGIAFYTFETLKEQRMRALCSPSKFLYNPFDRRVCSN